MRTETKAAAVRGSASLLVLLLIGAFAACHRHTATPTEALFAMAPRAGRVVEARLIRFAWSPIRVQRSGANGGVLDPARLELSGAAAAVIEATQNDLSPNGRRDAGMAYLIIGRDSEGVDALQAAAQKAPADAATWSDLAAARYTLAVRQNRAYELPLALAAADHALRLQPNLPDARFNRALIVERLGITEAARRAWKRYTEIDSSSDWASEALQHLGRLPVVTVETDFKQALSVATAASRHGDTAPLVAMVRAYPQEARTWGESKLLAEWAGALRAGDAKHASESLAVIRQIGNALLETNHEGLLADAVTAIDAGNQARRLELAEAHVVYWDGRVLYSKRQVTEARNMLQRASGLFAEGRSPMALVANYYVGSSRYDQNEYTDAHQSLDGLAARFDHGRYRSLGALIEWETSLCDSATGEWGTAIRMAAASTRTFGALGESRNRADIDSILANELDVTGQRYAAWKARTSAFSALSRAGATDRICQGLVSAIRVADAQGNTEAALALSDVALDDLLYSRQSSVGASVAEATRAELLDRLGDKAAARRSVAQARILAATIPDPELRLRASCSIDIAVSIVERPSNPGRSQELLDGVIASLTRRSSSGQLPKAYLERGRTRLAKGDEMAALTDFEHGIAELDAQRSTVSESTRRGVFYDTVPDLFAETIALLLHRGETARAFALADGARGRSLYEQLNAHVAAPPDTAQLEDVLRALPPQTAVIEYVMLHGRMAIFYAAPSGSGVVTMPFDRVALLASIERLADLLQRRGDPTAVQRESTSLYQTLLAPLAPRFEGVQQLIVIPDRELNAVPFGALYDHAGHRYLIDRFGVSVAPSVSFLLRRNPAWALNPALIVGDPRSSDEPELPEAAKDAEAIAAMYHAPTLLIGDDATRARFIVSARHSALIYYAGHAQSGSEDAYGALRLAAGEHHAAGDLDADDISHLELRNAPLVLLAACGTIRGEGGHVEGTPSVARAFLAAGARSVVGTLWDVDDDTTSRLFRGLHRQLRSGLTPSAALRAAQLELAHGDDPRLRHPSTWAPIELLGSPQ